MDGSELDEGPPRRTSLKRSYDQISRSPPPQRQEVPQPAWASLFQRAVSNHNPFIPTQPPMSHNVSNSPPTDGRRIGSENTFRYPGDGLDYRTPVMSQSFSHGQDQDTQPQEIIDLTADSPEQTFARPQPRRRSHSPSSSRRPAQEPPDVIDLDTPEFSRFLPLEHIARSRPERRAGTPAVDLTGPTPIDLEDDDIQFISENPVRQQNESVGGYLRRSAFPASVRDPSSRHSRHPSRRDPNAAVSMRPSSMNAIISGFARSFRQHEAVVNNWVGALRAPRPTGYRADRSISRHRHNFGTMFVPESGIPMGPNDLPPMAMDYANVAFDYNSGMPTRPTYEAPPAAPDGFTRSPRKEDVLLCPNCDCELGEGDDLEKQFWVSKDCGHVYCGVCAHTKRVNKKKAANIPSQETRPRLQLELDTCVIEGCGAKLSRKGQLFQVYY